MQPDIDILGKLVFPIAVAIAVALILKRLEYRPKLVTYLAHAAGFALPPIAGPMPETIASEGTAIAPVAAQGVQVHVHGVIVRNTGKKTAFNVRLGHNVAVHHYVIDPRVKHEVNSSAGGAWEILIPALVPNEQVLISYLYFPPVTWHQINAYTKSDEGLAQFLNVLPTPQPPRWLVIVFRLFFYLGIAALVYSAVSITQWVVTVTHSVAH